MQLDQVNNSTQGFYQRFTLRDRDTNVRILKYRPAFTRFPLLGHGTCPLVHRGCFLLSRV